MGQLPPLQLPKFAVNGTNLSVLEVLLELLQHDCELLGLYPAVGQQHAAELPLCDPPLHRVVPLKLEGEKRKKKQRHMETRLCSGKLCLGEGGKKPLIKSEHCRRHS